MSIELQDFTIGDTNYIGKHNANNSILKGAIDALQSAQSSAQQAGLAGPTLFKALFGAGASVIGKDSYKPTIVGTQLQIAAGYAWLPSAGAVANNPGVVSLDLTAAADGTYYVSANADGTPKYSASATDALYSVVKTGAALGSLTRIAKITWGDYDWQLAQNSSSLGVFESLDARLEAIETAVGTPLFIVGGFVSGVPGNASLLFVVLPSVAVTFAAAFAGSRAKSGVAATAATTLSIKKNGIQVGTISFAAGSAVGVFAAAAVTTLTNADELTIENQATADATLADIRFVLHGTR